MDEEKQNDGMIKKTGDALKKGAKKQAKNLAKKIIKKVIMAIGAFVLKIILPIIIAIIILTAIAEFFENLFSDESKNANAFAVKYTSSSFVGSGGTAISGEAGSEEEGSSLASIIVDINNATENGAYILTYEFKDENGNIYSDDQALTNIKNDLSEKNENLDLTQFSDSELKIIGALMYNGLMVEDSDEAELKALALFVKADIASKNLDLRKSEDTNIDALGEDEVYGTIRINKTRIEKDDNDNVKYSTEKLQFVSYEEFSNMVEQGNEQAIHSFTIDENGKIIFANWSTSETKYTYHPYQDIETILSDEEKQKISVENIKEGKEKEINIVMSTPIDVSQSITPYMMDYGLLSDLLIVTDNAEFCVDLAKTAFNSKIVINIKEELQTTKIEVQNDCIQTKLLYDYVKYEVSSQGEEEIKTETWNKLTDGSGEPRSSLDTLSSYGWFPGMNPTSDEFDAAYGETITYEWTYNNTGYKLIYRHTRNYTNWILYIKNIETTNVSLPKETNTNEEGDLINLNNNHIQEEYSDYTIDEDFTDSEIFKYTEFESTVLENNKYDIEISEVDCWYLKRHTGYQNPTPQDPEVKSNQASVPGEYSEDLQLVLETDNQEEISKDSHIEGFINQKINDYNNNYPEAKDVTCNVTSLAVKQREKTDKSTQYTTTITTYSFGEENAEDTYEQLKNVEYGNNEKIFKDDDNTGFLSIYNKYRQQGIDLYLEDDAEKQLFSLLENDPTTAGFPDLIKHLLYIYDGIDRGVTDYDISILLPKEFSSVKGLTGNTVADKIWYALRSLGYSKASVAGVLGNLHYESAGLNVDIIEKETEIGIGLAQWSYDRRTALESYAWSKGLVWTDEDTQIEFLIDEIDGQGKFTNGFATQAFLEVSYNDKTYNKEIWNNVDEIEDVDLAIEEATTAFCVSWERPADPNASLADRIKYAKEYYDYYKDKEYGGNFTTVDCTYPVSTKFESTSGKTFTIVQQSNSLFPKQCNRAACLSIASAYASPETSVNELIDFINSNHDSKWHGAIPSNEKYWNHYGLEITNVNAGEQTKDYMSSLEEQLNSGGYALIWLNNNNGSYVGKSGVLWTSLYHWIAILGIKYEDGGCYIATSTSGGGVSDWVPIDEFTTHGVYHMVFVNPIETTN